MTTRGLSNDIRPVGWNRAARKSFDKFPVVVRQRMNTALTIAAEGSKADIAKPLRGLGPGVMEIAVRYKTDAWRIVDAMESGGGPWLIHAFRKKSKSGIKTPKAEIDSVRKRLSWLKGELVK